MAQDAKARNKPPPMDVGGSSVITQSYADLNEPKILSRPDEDEKEATP
jgi:hypothetical protein